MKIAIKGLIGVGKTTISEIIKEEYGYSIVNADDIVRKLYEEDESVKKKIVDTFELERFSKKELANIVFSDREKLKILEGIVHPILEKEILKQIIGKENVLIDCQIIDKLNIEYDGQLLITCTKSTIIERVKKRDGRSEEEINNILQLQDRYSINKEKIMPINSEKEIQDIKVDIKKALTILENFKKFENEEEYYD